MNLHAVIAETGDIPLSIPQREYLKKYKGKDVKIAVDDKPTTEMRRYLEGAVIPYIFLQSDNAWTNYEDCREAILLEFLPKWVIDMSGNRAKTRISTTELSKEKFKNLIEQLNNWMEQNGYEIPDSIEFNNWKNSAPIAGEEYPPLVRLKEIYQGKKTTKTQIPRWRR